MAHIYQRGLVWWISYYPYPGAKLKQYSLKTRDKSVAKYKKNEIENRLLNGDAVMTRSDILLSDAFDEFAEYCKATLTPRTVDYYKETFGPFMKFLSPSAKLININDKMLTDYINSKPHYKPAMIWHVVKVAKTFLNFCVRRKYLAANPITMHKPKIPKKPPECWTIEETEKILGAATDPVIRGMIYLNLYCGLRPAELRRLKWQDIDFKNKILTVPEAKDGEFRRFPIHEKALDFLQNSKRIGELVFPSITDSILRRAAKSITKAAGVRRIRRFWYAIRHTFGTEYYKKTGDLRGLQEILGHSKIESTTVYVNPQEEHRRQQINKVSYDK